jgi:hypothetical protein
MCFAIGETRWALGRGKKVGDKSEVWPEVADMWGSAKRLKCRGRRWT